ncbi:Chemotaxis protein CheY [uncultured archaeon]|nr:Chemotaxis protein CheY [uncultured archaeon]
MKSIEDAESDVMALINEKQQVTYEELKDFSSSSEIAAATLDDALRELEKANAIASRSSGGILTYYMLQEEHQLKRIFVVEDDKNINKLIKLSLGKALGAEHEITQIYDGTEALKRIRGERPDLVVLDLMLPGIDGLDICQSIKKDPNYSDVTIIIVSALDATSNRFKGIKYGADYYIRKPFDPDELRNLVTIFLKKKGKKFDPLIDLPNEERISGSVEKALKESSADYEMGRIRVDGLAGFAGKFGNESGITILRLVSQLLQDNVKDAGGNAFVGFLNGDDFVIAGDKRNVDTIVESITSEFGAVVPFIYQSEGYKPIELGIDDIYGVQRPMLTLTYSEIEKATLMERRAEVLRRKKGDDDIGSYTYDELRHMLGSEGLDITITRDPSGGVKLQVGKNG